MAPRLALTVAVALAFVLLATGALAADAPEVLVDRVAVRFYAPETGGVTHPRFITERTLAFEARLDAMADGAGPELLPDDRHLHAALDRHVVEEILATLDVSSGSAQSDVSALVREARGALEERVGGAAKIAIAAEEEGMGAEEVQAYFERRGRAAAYLDRAVTRFLHPQDEQLHEVFRSSPHPYRGRPYDDVRALLSRWYAFERLKALEASFLQTARARLTVVMIPR